MVSFIELYALTDKIFESVAFSRLFISTFALIESPMNSVFGFLDTLHVGGGGVGSLLPVTVFVTDA